MENQGDRHNTGKLGWRLVPFFALEPMVRVLMFGEGKYDAWNWAKGLSWSGCIESLLRHTHALLGGQDFDEESKLHHVGHMMCNCLFLSYYIITGTGTDDRKKYLVD
jgi:hypothetical protein